MAQFLHLFETVSAFTEQYNGEAYEEPWVSYTEENNNVNYNKGSFSIRVATFNENDEVVYTDSFNKSFFVGPISYNDFDASDYIAWAQTIYYNNKGYSLSIQGLEESMYDSTHNSLFNDVNGIMYMYPDGSTTMTDATANHVFTIFMVRTITI